MAAEEGTPSRSARPMLRGTSFTGGSYLQEQNEYRTTPGSKFPSPSQPSVTADPSSIESVMMDSGSGSRISRIVDSGIVHAISHYNCQASAGELEGGAHREKLVATLFYKAHQPVHTHVHPDTVAGNASPERKVDLPAPPQPVLGYAPTVHMDNYPLEPPPPEPEQLDHLYGQYITQICLGHFLQVIQELQVPYSPVSSTHRCLDDPLHPRVVEVTFSPPPSEDYLSFSELRRHEALWRFEREWNVEIILQRDSVFRTHKRLAVFDMDSTLIGQETIDELARLAGKSHEVEHITAKAMNNELDFSHSLNSRVAVLKGQPVSILTEVQKYLIPAPGAKDLLKSLKVLGFKTALLSGGFLPTATNLAKELGIDYVYANNLGLTADGSALSGTIEGELIDGEKKKALVEQIALKEGITKKGQILVVGDGGNDLPMLKSVGDEGLGVAFKAKPKVQLEAPTKLNSESLTDLLFLLGLTIDQQAQLLS